VDGVVLRRQLRGHGRIDPLQLVIGDDVVHVLEHPLDPLAQLPGLLERHDRVLERGLVRVGGDGIDLLRLLRERPVEGGLVVRIRDLVERRQAER
jgi:hypothetical protein